MIYSKYFQSAAVVQFLLWLFSYQTLVKPVSWLFPAFSWWGWGDSVVLLGSRQIVEEHQSVEQSRRAQAEPISLDSCLKAFTSEEELGEDELYYCSKCKTHRLATKKLDLWRLPPILVSAPALHRPAPMSVCHLKFVQNINGVFRFRLFT